MPRPAPIDPDEDAARLRAAVKADDGFFTTFFVSSYSPHVVRAAARLGLSPNQVTVASMGVGALAAAAFATGERWGLIAGAVLLQVAFLLDCVDGQLARYTRQFSALGAWLDSVFDRTKEYLVYAGLAIGAARTGDTVWVLAAAAMGLQTARHAMDFSFSGTNDTEQATGVLAVARRHDTGALSWVKKMVVLPIGERFAVISLTAAIWDARTTFIVLLAWGGLAALYGFAGRAARGRAATAPELLFRYRDDGLLIPLLRRLGLPARLNRRLSWAVPPLLRVVEYAMILLFASIPGGSTYAGAFALIAAGAYRQYDLIYRADVPPRWTDAVALGWEVRALATLPLVLAGATPAALYALAAVIVVPLILESINARRMEVAVA
jgi:phosphatidylglycerophosphate synthase